MKEKITNSFKKLESQRKELISLYDSLSNEQRAFNPEPDAWNLLQVMRHIVTSERLSLASIQRKISSKANIPKAGIGSRARFLILQLALYLPFKFKTPKIAQVHEAQPDYESMKTEWNEVRSGYQELIDSNDTETFAKAIYRHPRAGMLNMFQTVEFMETHISHHIKQIGRIRSHPFYPVKNK